MIELAPYAGFTAAEIVGRASDIDADSPEVLANGNAGFNNAYIFKVCNVLQQYDYVTGVLCQSANVNQWSCFKPGKLVFSGGNIVYQKPTGAIDDLFFLDDFLGYNHAAAAPYVVAKVTSRTFYPNSSQVDVGCTLNMGEINWAAVGARYVGIEVYQSDGITLVGRGVYDLNTADYGTQNIYFQYLVDVSGHSASYSLKARIVFLDASNNLLSYFPGESAMYNVSLTYVGEPTLAFSLAPNSPWYNYSLDTAGSSVVVQNNTLNVYVGIDTNSDGAFDQTTPFMYLRNGSTYWYYDNSTGNWVSWDSNSTTEPPATAKITTFTGIAYKNISKVLPFSIQYGDAIEVIFGNLPRPL